MREISMKGIPLDDADRILPLVAGLLNCGGGALRFEEVPGEESLRALQYTIAEQIKPVSPVFVRPVGDDGAGLVVEVPAGSEPPYAYRDTAFAVEGDECHPASVNQIKEWVLGNAHGYNRWENRACLCDEVEPVVDRVSLNDAVKKINQIGRLKINASAGTLEILNELSLMRYGQLLNAGLVLLGRDPGRYAPQTVVRLTHFAGTKTSGRIIASKTFNGPLCDVIDNAAGYINEHSPRITNFSKENGNRIGDPVYPVFAVREAIVNACAHRDYESSFGGVSVLLFSDRLEIWNSGQLPNGVTEKILNKGEGAPSVLINPTIVGHLYARDYMEKTGRGSSVIPADSKAVGTSVRWKQFNGRGVRLTFTHSALELKSGNQTSIDGNVELRRVLDIIIDNEGLRKPALMSLTGFSSGVLQRALDALRRKQLIVYRGSNKTGGYYAI